nr:DUF3990 domain-containing protein [Mediterraneibacter faecis]
MFKEADVLGYIEKCYGSYCEVKEPDLAKCAKRKDFGQGFYLTTSKEQAIRKQTISASDSCCPIN